MEFEEYCRLKKIDSKSFEQAEPRIYADMKSMFSTTHIESFTIQKKFIINNLRRRFKPFIEVVTETAKPTSEPVAKKVVIPGVAKPQIKKPAPLMKSKTPNK